MVNSAHFTKRLEQIIQFYGLSATAFAEAIDFNRSTISHLLSGRNKPSLEFVMKVVQTYPEVELYWLLNGKGTFPPSQTSSSSQPIVKKEPIVETVKISEEIEKKISKEAKQPSIVPINPSNNDGNIDRIIIFYKNGSFKEYLP